MNNKYITAETIMNRVASVHKERSQEFDVNDYIEWCAECETEYLGDVESMTLYKEVELVVDNGQALLPCNLYRLLDICTSDSMTPQNREPYYNDGTYLHFNDDFDADKIYINYYGIAIDTDTGFPVIKKGHEQACEKFCIKKIYEELFYLQKLNANVWAEINTELTLELSAADGSVRDFSRNDLQEISKIIGNMLPQIGMIPTYNIDK